MNKNLFKTFAIAAMAVLAGACAKEQVAQEGQTGMVTFEVENPVAVTKAIGDGMTAKQLYYQVFDADGNPIAGLPVQKKTLSSLKTTVSFQLIKDQTYNFIFWAQTAEVGYYTIDGAEGLKKITANYEGKKSNDENFDAFYAVEKALTINGPITKTITLKRPFAQINIATTDVLKAGETTSKVIFDGAMSAVKVKDVPTVFSPLTDGFSKSADVEFASAAIPGGDFIIAGSADTYKHMAVNYVFAPVDGTVYDVEASLKVEGKDVAVKVPSAPVKRNWRTNIVGDLLTTSTDFDIIVEPGFDDDTDIDITKVKTVAGLNAALANGGKVTVVGDITSTEKPFYVKKEKTEISISAGVTVTAELTGYSGKTLAYYDNVGSQILSGEGTIIGPKVDLASSAAAIEVEDNANNLVVDGNLTIKGRKGTKSENVDACMIIRAGKVTINGGHFVANTDVDGKENPAILLFSPNSYRSELVINGGIFESLINGDSQYLINMQDEYRDHCKISIYGGKFKNFDPGNVNEGTITSFLAPGYKSTKVGEYYVVTKEDVTPVADQAGLDEAMSKLTSEPATISLPAGNFSTYGKKATQGKTLTFNGAGAENTNFVVGKNLGVSGEGSSDYSLENADVTFNDLTITTGDGLSYDYRGFVRAKSLTFVNCTIKERLSYWGGVVKFINCKFEPNTKKEDGSIVPDYNITTYQGTEFSFENCSFKSAGKFMNLYKEENVPYVVRVKDCTFIATEIDKPVLNMKSYTGVEYKIYFEGTNIAKTEDGVEFPLYGGETASNAEVYVNNSLVWSKGQAF